MLDRNEARLFSSKRLVAVVSSKSLQIVVREPVLIDFLVSGLLRSTLPYL